MTQISTETYRLLIDPVALDHQIALTFEFIESLILSGKGQNSIDSYRGILELLEEIRCQHDDMRSPKEPPISPSLGAGGVRNL